MANPYGGPSGTGYLMETIRGERGGHERERVLDGSAIPTGRIVAWILGRVKPHAGLAAASFALTLVAVVCQLAIPILIGDAIDCILPGLAPGEELLRTLALLAASVCVSAAAGWGAQAAASALSAHTTRDIREAAYARLHDLPLSFIDTHSHGDLLARITGDIEMIGDGLLQGTTQLFTGALTIVGTLAFMCTMSVPITLIVVVLTPVSAAAAAALARGSAKSFAAQQHLAGELAGYATEMIGANRLIALFGRADESVAAFSEINARLKEDGERAQFISSLANPTTRLVNNVIYAVIAVVGCTAVITGAPSALTIGQVQSFLSYSNQYMKPFNEISSVAGQVVGAIESARRVLALIDEPAEAPDPVAPAALDRAVGTVSFDDVVFSYDKNDPLIQGVSFEVARGSRTALVGPSGCGKTTLVNLLMRFYELDGGQIRVCGRDIRETSRDELRSVFGMVLQDTWIVAGSVADNIAFGVPGATREQVRAAAERAHARKFIEQLPQGFDTRIGEGGTELSEGQRQLICIARVMLADPEMLILDEATSSIDTRTELQVQAAFDEMMRGRTSIVIAHRLSTVRDADEILVMREGKIVERGTHKMLLSEDGYYADLVRSQFAEE